MIGLRIRAALLAFRWPVLVGHGVLAEEYDEVRAELERLRLSGEENLARSKEAILQTAAGAMDAAIGCAERDMPREDDDWWDGYDAAVSDIRFSLTKAKAECLETLGRVCR